MHFRALLNWIRLTFLNNHLRFSLLRSSGGCLRMGPRRAVLQRMLLLLLLLGRRLLPWQGLRLRLRLHSSWSSRRDRPCRLRRLRVALLEGRSRAVGRRSSERRTRRLPLGDRAIKIGHEGS